MESNPRAKGRAVGQPTFRFQELAQQDGSPGRTIDFTCVSVRPLSYASLVQAKLHTKLTIPFESEDSNVVDSDIEGLDRSNSYKMNTMLHSVFTSRAIGLVKNGWLPSTLAATHHRAMVLLDRNIVSEIIRRFHSGRTNGAEPDFLDLFADWPVRINPLLFAIEGNARTIPTPELVRAQLAEVVKKLRAALPSAKLMANPGHLKGALGLVEDSRPGMARKQAFLVRLAPTLTAPVSRQNMQARWNDVLIAADECGVSRGSLVVLAALSSVVVPKGTSPAKKLLKFKAGYCKDDAYNALCDLRSLEILIYAFALFPREQVQLCTADKNLALFWTGIGASNFQRAGNGISFDLSPVEELLPESRLHEWRSCITAGSGKR